MERFIISGPNKISGEISVAGAKNHALKLIPACLLADKPCVIKNVPKIKDVEMMLKILEALGAKIKKINENDYQIDSRGVKSPYIPNELGRKLRSSVMLMAPLLARFGEVKLPHPGGCVIGKRPIDMFLSGFESMGVKLKEEKDHYHLKAPSGLKGSKYVFRKISVTVTESMIMAACLAKGETELVFTACEPEILSLCEFLNSIGAKITGAGTNRILIKGVKKLSVGSWTCIPDRIETGTFAILGAMGGGELLIKNCDPSHLEVFWLYLEQAGVNFELGKNWVKVRGAKSKLKAVADVTTHEYPGLVTDLQAPFTVLLTQAKGLSMVHETIFEGRLFYTDILNRMGADIILCDPHRVVVNGPAKLVGKKIESPDLRAGMALLIAAIIAKGETEIENVYQIKRGYENIEERLKKIGVNIKTVDDCKIN